MRRSLQQMVTQRAPKSRAAQRMAHLDPVLTSTSSARQLSSVARKTKPVSLAFRVLFSAGSLVRMLTACFGTSEFKSTEPLRGC